ncbi:uncharacterized protein LOC126560706 [Anopheles maculipalpis]|uniref:uncharacterized protein LOC126560706 n=1 Tax=Anopheles maculipalpis TaxID=1496333 RepID=UPI002158C660|nr:uncharacterized protein LOC126560706 [Anopheles maculipalpis]
MSEDFDIYGDLEHIEQEAKQESQQLVALQQKIKELQEKVNAVEQEKTDIVRKNEILLENVSSLLLTAKAEIKRKDATISDLSKQCDNVVFRRNDHVAKSVKYETKFTQTTLPHPAYVEAQNRSVECSDRKRSKSRIDDVRESNHNRDREQDWVHKSKVISERDRSHCRDRTTNSEKERHRDQERNRDHELDRYRDRDQDRNRNRNREHDSDRDRDRDRHRDRHRNSHHDRHESHKNHRSRERSRVKETHNVSSKKHQKLVKCHTREQERSSSQKHATDRHKPSKADDRHKSNTRLSEHKQAHKDIDRRTPEFSDRANHETVTNTDSDHKIKQMKQKNIETKRQEIASNTWEQPSTSNKSFHRSSPNCSKSLETVDTNTTVQICDDSRMQKKRTEGFIQQMQDNQTAVNGNSYQPKKAYSETPLSLITEAPPAKHHIQTNITNASDKKQDKRNKASKSKSRSAAADDENNDAGKKEQQNKLCPQEATTDEPNESLLEFERKVECLDSYQHNTIQSKAANRQLQKSSQQEATKHADLIAPVTTKKDDPVHNRETNSVLPLFTSVVENSVSAESSNTNNWSTNDKQQHSLSISERNSLSESKSLCLNLNDTRSNSYSAVLESGVNQPSEPTTMSIQTYFMTFNEQDDEHEKSTREDAESLPMNVETISENDTIVLSVASEVEVETNSTPIDTMSEIRCKAKVSTAEAIRERLRKRTSANVQKATPASKMSMSSIFPKRRLSIDSVVSITGKRKKVENTTMVDDAKQSCTPSTKLSSTYFSPIALPITSVLDSISNKLKSPTMKHSAWDSMLMTPMVVVHSPAKPSQNTNQHVPNYYASSPSDATLYNIMESLFQTPIKNEAPDRVSPPSATDNSNDDARQKSTTTILTSYENEGTCSTPLSSKPMARFCPDDDHTAKQLSHKSTATPTGVSFTKGNNMERLNPQTQTTQPVKRNCPEPEACTSKDIKAPIQADPHPQHLIDRSILEPVNSARPETTSSQTNAEQLPVSVNAAPTANAQARDKEEVTSTCVVSNVTLNLSLADNTSKKYNSLRKSSAPVHHVREMRIVKESPSLMRIYIKRK